MNIKHGDRRTRLYNIWCGIRKRCNDSNEQNYPYYGGRGISVCDAWSEYINFKEWAIANGYNDNLSIDRIDCDGDYCPENCRWVDKITQANNTSRNHRIEIDGDIKTVAEWCRVYDVEPYNFYNRLRRGWDEIRAVTTPVRHVGV